jgi:hypothetical protein
MLAAGRDTVLGDAAAEEQLFLTGDYEDIALADISGALLMQKLQTLFMYDVSLHVTDCQDVALADISGVHLLHKNHAV